MNVALYFGQGFYLFDSLFLDKAEIVEENPPAANLNEIAFLFSHEDHPLRRNGEKLDKVVKQSQLWIIHNFDTSDCGWFFVDQERKWHYLYQRTN